MFGLEWVKFRGWCVFGGIGFNGELDKRIKINLLFIKYKKFLYNIFEKKKIVCEKRVVCY